MRTGYALAVPNFRRSHQPGGTFFFTVVTHRRHPIFADSLAREVLRHSIDQTRRRRPFEINAIVLLPDHLHLIWTQPEGDADFSTRWRKIKESFSRNYRRQGGQPGAISQGQHRKGLTGFWQPRFWEHTIRDDVDFRRHVDYIHFNPAKHGLASCPHAWAWSSFSNWVRSGVYPLDWCCACNNRTAATPDFSGTSEATGE
ncbi:MAG TPA: transposase [Phycisphaerae bacterium]|nr:transposase [Phycisphaerae bacterium]HRW53767.1 transposase [Phycisphaerae bacterium]